ncbi:DUF1501 domain-containing protein [Paludisphaera borealis]|uniref:DUF1501 domain-containing protein n=1 Tax=Paludisphaera borealis TaxID=1387353 RepID=A0A1U7CWM9_9BACT|nr:DUF1501 domain-containing protein [Paludisphaera borealis]APW63360.1 hypothetical protein BSF38_04924 [Paludisphaera borealis]
MLTLGGQAHGSFCDGMRRRDFLKLGGLALGGLSLPQLLRAESQAGVGKSHKAIIMVFLAGGPPHQDMFDLKPDAPSGIRGDFKPIATNVPGFDICEHMPRMAKMMDKFAVIRSLVGSGPDHSAGQCLTGYTDLVSRVQGGRPSLGSIVAKLEGPIHSDIPPFVGLSPRVGHPPWANPGDPGYLGLAYAPFAPFRAEGSDGKTGDNPDSVGLKLDESVIIPDRLAGRRSLLGQLDQFRRGLEQSPAIQGADSFTTRAFDILGSRKVFEALDLSKEDPRLRARYGIGDMKQEFDGPPCCMDHFLMARRLVEAGVRVVTLAFGRWDTHSDNFSTNAERIPKLDMGLSALVEDLHNRGMDKDVSVVVWGEFGRTPQINAQAGRDHWPPVNFVALAGGGMRTGQVIGSTDKHAAFAKDRPITYPSVFSTLYHNLGIEPSTAVPDRGGRPMFLLDDREPIQELI